MPRNFHQALDNLKMPALMENAKFECYSIKNLPVDSFLNRFDDSEYLRRSDSKTYSMLSDETVYYFIVRKVMVLRSCLSENVDSSLKITLMYAAGKCVSVEQCSGLLSNMRENIKFSLTSLPDFYNYFSHTYIPGRSGGMQERSVFPCINHDDTDLSLGCLKEELGRTDEQVYELLTHCAFREAVLPHKTAKQQRISFRYDVARNRGGNDGEVGGSRGNGPGDGAGAGGDGDGAGGGGGGGGGDGGGVANFLNIPIFSRTPGNPLQLLSHFLLLPEMNRNQVLTALHHVWCNFANEQPRQNITRESVWPGHRVIFQGLLNVYEPNPVEEDYVELDFEGDWASFQYRIEQIIVEPLAA
ncbi:uncharacterized protein LOC125370453 isoform X2 [Ricinus communis]|uniref:uncharacterized protein LOC125370453 isoform X2 n=1 Tax=Ricinus communis TaxID=3988 RepID=UPI00201B134F|nr:uncharacterized protein LOC125370453 isoform X2 [Ricinus communis]